MLNNCLIPRPCRKPHRIYVGDGKKLSLQEQMGMTECSDVLSEILLTIRQTCINHGVDLDVAYRRQNTAVLRAVTEELLTELPFLQEYENAWPIEYYFSRQLKSHRRYSQASKRNPKALRTVHLRRQTSFKVAARYGRRTATTRRTSLMHYSTIPVHRRKRRSEPRPASRSESPSAIAQDERDVERLLQLSPRSHAMSPSPSITLPSSSPSDPLCDLFISALVPRADARRLTDVLAAKGIEDLAYLKVFARMSTRDSWLEELVRKEELTEIQMRVLREILESQK